MIGYLEQLNRKERYFLIGLALGNPKFKLDKSFRAKLNNGFHVDIPENAFVAMDYHLNWIYAAAELAFGKSVHEQIYQNNDNVIDGTQEDVDLLVAYEDTSGISQLIMLEAKGVTSFSNEQFKHKIDRFTKMFGNKGDKFAKFKPYFGLVSPRKSRNLCVDCCPSWLKVDGDIPWFEMKIPPRLVLFGCDENGKSSSERKFWKVKIE
jgi:hypothetical protein